MAMQPIKSYQQDDPLLSLSSPGKKPMPIVSRGLSNDMNAPYAPTMPAPKLRGQQSGVDRAGQPVYSGVNRSRAGNISNPSFTGELADMGKQIKSVLPELATNSAQPKTLPPLGQKAAPVVAPPKAEQAKPESIISQAAPQETDAQMMRMQNISDTGIPFQQSTDKKINFTNPDGSGYGTVDFGSPERNAEMAAKLQDGKGAMYKGPGLPAPRPELSQAQQAPQLQMPAMNQGGNAYDDEIAMTLDAIDRNTPDAMDSIGTVRAKKMALASLAARLDVLRGARGDTIESRDRSNALNANVGMANQKLQADFANGQLQSQADMLKSRQDQDQFKAQQKMDKRRLDLEQEKIEQDKFTPYYESVYDPKTQVESKKLAGGFNTRTGMPVLANNKPKQPQATVAPKQALDDLLKNPNLKDQFLNKYGYLPDGMK